MSFCKYANILGAPNQGIHKYRFMGVAIVDVIMTIALGLFIAHYFKLQYAYSKLKSSFL